MRRRIRRLLDNYFLCYLHSMKWAALSAITMALLMIWTNWGAEPIEIARAAVAQGLYTFTVGVFLLEIYNFLVSARIRAFITIDRIPFLHHLVPILVPIILTCLFTYLVHVFTGTPRPFNSTLPTMITAPFVYTYWHFRLEVNSWIKSRFQK